MVWFQRIVPITAFIVGVSALGVQAFILYPWHNRLDEDFHALRDTKTAQDIKLEKYNNQKLERITSIENKLLHYIARQKELEAKMRPKLP